MRQVSGQAEDTEEEPDRGHSIGGLAIADHAGVLYSFTAYPLRSRPEISGHVVYAFCRLEGSTPVPLFVGTTDRLAKRLVDHAALEAAQGLGAVYLLVHQPDADDEIDTVEATERLVAAYRPVLNGATAKLSAWLPEPLGQQAAEGPAPVPPTA